MSSTGPTRPGLERKKRPGGGRLSFIGFVLKTAWLAAIVFAIFFLMKMHKEPQGTAVSPNAEAHPGTAAGPGVSVSPTQPGQEPPVNVEPITADSIKRQQLAEAKFKQRQLITTYGKVTHALSEWEQELAAWEKVGPPLPKADDGKKLATDATLVKHYRAVMRQERPTREELTSTRTLADDLISPVRDAVNNSEDASIPPEDMATNLREVRTKAQKACNDLRAIREQIEALIAQAGDTPGNETLEAAIRRQVQEEANERTTLIEATVKKARDEGNQRVAEEQANSARVALELEANRIREESDERKAEAARLADARRAAQAKKAEEARMALLRQKAWSPEVTHHLGIFLQKSYTQPGPGGAYQKTVELAPVSFSRLETSGALEKTPQGLEKLCYGCAHSLSGNDRIKWNMSAYKDNWSPADQAFVQRVQDMLIELGPALVAEKRLSP